MGTFVSYMLQVSVVMTLMYLAYKWLLSTSTFHRMNRIALLFIYAFSWMLPFASGFVESKMAGNPSVEIGMPIMTELVTVSVAPDRQFDWWRIVLWVYLAGAGLCMLFTLVAVIRMAVVIRSGRRYRLGGYIEVMTDRAPGPFSWGRYVVVRTVDIDSSHRMVVGHEVTHLRLFHWLDLIPAQITAILQWFSPAAWLMMRDLKDVHEYEVDRIVGGDDPSDYQMMLLKKTVGSSFPVFADSLNHSQTKKRLTMMMIKKSSPSRRVAALALPAAAALAVFTLSQPVVAGVVDHVAAATVSDVSESKDNESRAALQIRIADYGAEEESVAEIRINPDSGISAQAETEAETEAAAANEKSPATESTGSPKEEKPAYFLDGKLFTGELTSIASDDVASMSIVKNDPEYPQGKILIVSKTAASKQNEGKLYLKPNSIAEFEGGHKALKQFVIENTKLPEGLDLQGKPVRIIVQFTIAADGNVSDARILKGAGDRFSKEVSDALDTEALRLIRSTGGKWKPAENDGVPVASQFTIPVSFSSK